MQPQTILTQQHSVWCEGEGASGHPRVYLHIVSESNTVRCPYCSRTWMLAEGDDASHAGH